MKPMFLPDVEGNPAPGPYRSLIEQMQDQGAEYPQIWHLFAFLPRATEHLARYPGDSPDRGRSVLAA